MSALVLVLVVGWTRWSECAVTMYVAYTPSAGPDGVAYDGQRYCGDRQHEKYSRPSRFLTCFCPCALNSFPLPDLAALYPPSPACTIVPLPVLLFLDTPPLQIYLVHLNLRPPPTLMVLTSSPGVTCLAPLLSLAYT